MLFQVDKISLTTNHFHSYYGGSEIIVAGKVSSSNEGQLDEDLGAQVDALNGAEHKEVLYKPLFTSENNPVRLSSIYKMTGWMDRG
jgi:D-lyxose ketol-isomerase